MRECKLSGVGRTAALAGTSIVDNRLPGASSLGAVVPQRLLLGHRDLVVPDRGCMERGRQGRLDLGHVRAHAGQDQERRHRRRREQPLPPVQGGRRADAVDRCECVPVLDRVAAHLSAGNGRAEPEGDRFLRPAGGRAHRGGHRAVRHALPLGAAASARGSGGAGARDTPARRSPTTRATWPRGSATASATSSRSTSSARSWTWGITARRSRFPVAQ
jgi:hypothetical protein